MSTGARGKTEVYGVSTRLDGNQQRVIVRASSRAAAVRALNAAGLYVTDAFLRDYGAITGNSHELSVAAESGVVWATPAEHRPHPAFVRVNPKATKEQS